MAQRAIMLIRVFCYIAVIAGTLLFTFRPANIALPPHVQSIKNMTLIGNALSRYEHNHGHLPVELADLVPEYVSFSNTFVFFHSSHRNQYLSSGDVRKHIRDVGAFVYLGEHGREIDIVLYQKSHLWPQANIDGIATLGTNYSVKHFKLQIVEERLKLLNLARQP